VESFRVSDPEVLPAELFCSPGLGPRARSLIAEDDERSLNAAVTIDAVADRNAQRSEASESSGELMRITAMILP